MLSAFLFGLSLFLLYPVLPDTAQSVDGQVLTWWQLAPAFAIAGVFVFNVNVSGDAHAFSVSEVPLVLGLLFTSPRELVLARIAGEAVALIAKERQTPGKLVFNLSLLSAETCLAMTVFRLLAGDAAVAVPSTWGAALVAVSSAALLGVVVVWTVVCWHGGRADPGQLLLAAGVTAVCNASLAVIAAVLLVDQRAALVPLVLVIAVVIAAYRGYTSLTKRYAGLEMLYRFTRRTSSPARPAETVDKVLDEALNLLRADSAAVVVLPAEGEDPICMSRGGRMLLDLEGFRSGPVADLHQSVLAQSQTVVIPRTTRDPAERAMLARLGVRDCMIAPLTSPGGVIGIIMVGDRLGELNTFDAEDARLFATLSSHAGIALENGRLIERLHAEVSAREHEALHDPLTGLPNRTLFAQQVGSALDGDEQVGVLLMDLDRFKEVNDTLGHDAGDQFLQEVANRLLRSVGTGNLVARLGGDEFAVLLPGIEGAEDAVQHAERIHSAVTGPLRLGALPLEVDASIGIAVRPQHGNDLATLLRRADVAMYAAKGCRGRVALYDPRSDWNCERRLRLAGELRAALAGHHLDVHYQPISRLTDGGVVAVEALVRWNHPELGSLPPEEFIPVAERAGLIDELTLYVLDDAARQSRVWQAVDLDIRVAVNLSVHVLRDTSWPERVVDVLASHEVTADRLTFEITESGIMADPEQTIPVLDELARAGVLFSIDDFGTGYSSLSYLQQLPVSEIKIDKSFVLPMTGNTAAASIVRSVVDLARGLDLRVVAEGVEDQLTLDSLAATACHFAQGFYLTRPLPAEDLTNWLVRRHGRSTRAGARLPLRTPA